MLNARPAPVSYPKIKVPGRATMTKMLDELDAIADEQCIENQEKEIAYLQAQK